MSNKVIAWDGTALHLVISLLLINGLIYGLSLLFDDIGSIDFHILATIIFVIGAYRNGAILMYEGWKEDDYEYVVPNKTVTRIIDLIIILIVLYIFIS